MPTRALPVPPGKPATPADDKGLLIRRYFDPLRRPLTGTVSVIAVGHIEYGHDVIPAGAKGDVQLVDGLLQVSLHPGVYRLLFRGHTEDGHELVDDITVTVPAN